MKRRGVWQALLFQAVLTVVSCGPEPEGFQPEEARTATQTAQLRFKPIRRALVLSTRAQGEAPSREALAAERAGLRALVVTPAQWRVMTAEQFKGYSALIIGDEACSEDGSGTLQAATDTRRIWGPIIDGNIFVIASDPSTNHTPILVERGVEFATAKEDATGLYVSLGCAYQRAAPGTSVPLLEPFGDFLVAGMGCHTAAHVFTMSPKELTGDLYGADDRLIGGGCAARTVFTRYPEQTFGTAALAVDTEGYMPGAKPYVDPFWDGSRGGLFVGTPYILARGGLPQIPNRPPEARCKDLVLDADRTCGANESVDNGSSDPDGDLVGCTQSPAGPYPLGSTTVTLTCTDSQQQNSSCTATVQVRDVTAPELALVGSTSQPAECGTSYTDPGATAFDFCDGDLSSAITVSGNVNTGTPGTYGLTFDVQDSSGNRAPSVSRTVDVRDTLVPNFVVIGQLDMTAECGIPYVDPGAAAVDLCAGDVPVVATRTGNTNQPGTFTVSYRASDPSGNTVTAPFQRHVTVIDSEPPVLALLGPAPHVVECNPTPYADPGATATDQCFGDVTSRIVRTGEVNRRVPGTYPLTYNVTDPAGNNAVPVNRTVQVRDTIPPNITFSGQINLVLECDPNGTFFDSGVSAFDACAGPVPVNRSGTVDLSHPGIYSLTYSASDPSGNSTLPRTRSVSVRDTLAPVLTLNGGSFITIVQGTPWIDPGVTARDRCEGEIPIFITGSVNTDVPGTYLLRYNATDFSGNYGTATRTVTVVPAASGFVSQTSTAEQ